jgi:hypothetical protein
MRQELVTRDDLRRALMRNAARSPLAVGVGLALVVAALAISPGWLLPLAFVVYLALATTTYLDGNVAERVGKRLYESRRLPSAAPPGLAPDLEALVERARVEERRVVEAIERADLPLEEVSVEVAGLAREMERIAGRAQVIETYLAGHDAADLRRRRAELLKSDADPGVQEARRRAASALEDQLRLGGTLTGELRRFRAEMEHLIASLAVIHGQVVRISVSADPQLQAAVARDVRELRGRVGALADGLRDATADLAP